MKRLLLSSSVLLLSAMSLSAAESNRAEKWEFYIAPQYISGKTLDFSGGSSAELNDMASLMFGFGYNFDQHLNVGAYFNSTSGNYKGTATASDGSTSTFTSTMYSSAINLTVGYNLLEGNFTPYIMGNFGLTYIDSGVASGLSSGCYYLPWYGYTCSTYQTSYTTTQFNYGGQVGVRYDFPNALYLKAGVGLNWVDIEGNPDFTVYNVTIGFKFR